MANVQCVESLYRIVFTERIREKCFRLPVSSEKWWKSCRKCCSQEWPTWNGRNRQVSGGKNAANINYIYISTNLGHICFAYQFMWNDTSIVFSFVFFVCLLINNRYNVNDIPLFDDGDGVKISTRVESDDNPNKIWAWQSKEEWAIENEREKKTQNMCWKLLFAHKKIPVSTTEVIA